MRWAQLESAEPELAAEARGFLEARTHLTLATLRRSGAPRISGTEVKLHAGDLWMGSMWRARKALDLRRDPRFSLHSGCDDPPGWRGDATVSGRLVEVTDPDEKRAVYPPGAAPPGPMHVFRADVAEVLVVRLGEPGDHLALTAWRAGEPARRFTRR